MLNTVNAYSLVVSDFMSPLYRLNTLLYSLSYIPIALSTYSGLAWITNDACLFSLTVVTLTSSHATTSLSLCPLSAPHFPLRPTLSQEKRSASLKNPSAIGNSNLYQCSFHIPSLQSFHFNHITDHFHIFFLIM